jgi:hypothetical protein
VVGIVKEVDLIRVMVEVVVEMVWEEDMVVMVIKDKEVMEVKVKLVNKRILMEKEMG